MIAPMFVFCAVVEESMADGAVFLVARFRTDSFCSRLLRKFPVLVDEIGSAICFIGSLLYF
jgi:hypothetical protein